MRVVIADTGLLNYLVLIEQVHVLPALFTTVIIPEAVRAELAHSEAPAPVRHGWPRCLRGSCFERHRRS